MLAAAVMAVNMNALFRVDASEGRVPLQPSGDDVIDHFRLGEG